MKTLLKVLGRSISHHRFLYILCLLLGGISELLILVQPHLGGEMSSEGIVADPNMPVLADADLDGLYLAALEPYPYLMTPTQVAEFACGTPGGVRHLLKMGGGD